MENLYNEEEVPSCSPNGGCEIINELLESKNSVEAYFVYKRDMEREILYNEEKIFELMNQMRDLIQDNKNFRNLIDEMFYRTIKS